MLLVETVVFEGSEFVFESALPEVSGDYYCKVQICATQFIPIQLLF